MYKNIQVSIITVNYNNAEGLRNTIESVMNQNFNQFEFIIIDGGSTDESVRVIREYEEHIDYWVSEPDNGIYHAMNKGIAIAKGDYCNFMNSGDCFYDKEVLKSIFCQKKLSDIICGNTYMEEWIRAPQDITFDFLFKDTICHQCAFIKRSLLLKYNYDESLKLVSDRKFFLQSLILENCSYTAVDVNVVLYDTNGISSQNRALSDLEYRVVLEELIPKRIRVDYGKRYKGSLYNDTFYDKLFMEIGLRKYRNFIYTVTVLFFRCVSLFRSSARFIRDYPINI